jgi:hypothetical protein
MRILLFLFSLVSHIGYGWGEVGHHLIARAAAQVLKFHPKLSSNQSPSAANENLESFLKVFKDKQYQEGYLANIPDTYWRNLEGSQSEVGQLLGSSTHYFNLEHLSKRLPSDGFSIPNIVLDFETTKKESNIADFFTKVGTLPWRAQQFSDLYFQSLEKQSQNPCSSSPQSENQTRLVTAYAGLLAHFTGDVSMPYHTSIDHDARAVGQKGIHIYFENHLVSELEMDNFYYKVVKRTLELLNSPTSIDGIPSLQSLYADVARKDFQKKGTAPTTFDLMLAVISNSHSLIERLRQLDYTFAVATLDESLEMKECRNFAVVKELKNQYGKLEKEEQRKIFGKVKVLSIPSDYDDKKTEPACRRKPSTRVNEDGELSDNGKTVAQWHESLIVDRLALAAMLTADVWVTQWLKARTPQLCPTYLYAHKPNFISPTDKKCSGYALKELPKNFLMKNAKSALTQSPKRDDLNSCLAF